MDKWINDIRNQLRDYQQEPPEDLWNSVQAQLEQEGLPRATRRKTPVWMPWSRRIAVAACIAGTVIMGLKYMPDAQQHADILPTEAAQQTSAIAMSTQPCHAAPVATSKRETALTTPTAHTPEYVATIAVTSNEDSMPIADAEEQTATTPTTDSTSPSSLTTTHRRNTLRTSTSRQQTLPHSTSNTHTRLSVAAYTAGMSTAEDITRGLGDAPDMAIGADAAAWNDSPSLALAVFNQGKTTERDIHHRMPVRVGAACAYDLSNKVALGSGLTYTRLRSDLREGTADNYQKSVQTLHYVGLPINVKYTFLRRKGLSVYAQAGALAEVRVAGKQTTHYTLGGKDGGEENCNITSHPLQMSVGAAVGAQYNLTPTVALYAEPGASYYFRDNSSVPTIYEEKPANFTLNVGIRFSVGRRRALQQGHSYRKVCTSTPIFAQKSVL